MLTKQPLELWGGVECTVARIGDGFRDQIVETGHRERIEDLDRIAALGIRTLRYPVIWETIAPGDPTQADWSWHDERLRRLQELGIDPIAGLCHHGSGPCGTSLLDPDFPEKLARHARSVAARYPWINHYTPVNEPLTTARFAALYGHWYPHAASYGDFLRALFVQCKAVVLSMRAIREVRPDARLVQTDDLGRTFSTPALAYQAEHDNERRWLTFDLLCGRVTREHPFWGFFIHSAGLSEADLAVFHEGDGAPDIIGINHYLTSDRYLDENLRRYPEHLRGGNDRRPYADVEAVRMPMPDAELGPAARLREVWDRYRRPVAITEAHHGCTRDEQVRWLLEVWKAAEAVRAEGADIRAVTIWSLFGTVDWNSLLTERSGIYEVGPFDVRGPEPRPTALAHAAEALARHGRYDHPVLDRPGWWKRPSRFYRRASRASASRCSAVVPRRLIVAGATGVLGRTVSRLCDHRALDHVLLHRGEMDIADPGSVAAALSRHRPWGVVNAAGYARVDEAEREPERCFRENAVGAETLAKACAKAGIPLLTFSTDLVFDGRLGRPYAEADQINPTGVLGASKAEAERRVLSAHPGALVVRSGPLFGPWDDRNFLVAVLRTLADGDAVEAGIDEVSPTYGPDLCHVALDLLIDGAAGVWHLPSAGATSWAEFARAAAARAGFDPERVRPSGDGPALSTALTSERGLLLPPLEGALDRFHRDGEVDWAAGSRGLRIAAE